MEQKINEISTSVLTIILILMPVGMLPNFDSYAIRYLGLLICGGFLFITFLFKLKYIKSSLTDKLIYIFLILGIISTIFSIDIKQSIIGDDFRYEGIWTISIYFFVYFHAKHSFKDFKLFKPLIFLIYVLICILAILQYYINFRFPLLYYYYGVPYGTFGNTNFLGTFVSLLLPISMLIYILKNKKIFLLISIIAFFAMIISTARSSWVAFGFYMLFTIIYLILKKDKNFGKRFCIICIAFIISFTFIMITKNNNIFDKFSYIKRDLSSFKNYGINNKMGSGRIEIWKITLKVIKNRPLTGCGVDALNKGLEKYASEEYFNYIENHGFGIDKAHNEYLQIAATMGIPALIVYLSFITSIVISNFKKIFKDEKSLILLTSILSYLIQALFNISVISIAPIFWFVLGIAARN